VPGLGGLSNVAKRNAKTDLVVHRPTKPNVARKQNYKITQRPGHAFIRIVSSCLFVIESESRARVRVRFNTLRSAHEVRDRLQRAQMKCSCSRVGRYEEEKVKTY
jgi:hypothetical protein